MACEIAVRGRDDPDVNPDRPRAAETFQLAVLEYPQQLGLHLQRKLADLVQEDAGAVGDLEPTDLLADCARVGHFLAAEELALDQGRARGGVVHRNEGPFGALDR